MTQAQQSPVVLLPTFEVVSPSEKLELHWKTADNGVFNPEKGIVDFGSGSTNYLMLGGKKFQLKQFHFHAPSEHTREIDKTVRPLDAELHIVHQNPADGTYAVVGIFLRIIEGSDTAIPLNPASWIPDVNVPYFRYEGSLTTPPYDESVSWIIFKYSKDIRRGAYNHIFAAHPHLPRDVQPLNRRYVISCNGGFTLSR